MNGSAEAYLLGLWIGDGAIHKNGAFFFVGLDAEQAFRAAYREWSGEDPKMYHHRSTFKVCWSGLWGKRLRELGYSWPCRAEDKSIKPRLGAHLWDLIDGLWQSDGTIYIGSTTRNLRYGYCRSQLLAEQIKTYLNRNSIDARIGRTTAGGKPVWAVNIPKRDQAKMARHMVLQGSKELKLELMR